MARGKDRDGLTTLLAICAGFAAIAGGGGLLNLILKDPPPQMPAGTAVLSGLVLDWDASADGRVVAAEIRGAHRQMGDTREHLALVRADGSEENLGYGATLPAVSPDGRWIAWLASRERSAHLGPGRVRAVAGGPEVALPAAMPPFVFRPDSVSFFSGYDPTLGDGTLSRMSFADRVPRVISSNVPFASLLVGTNAAPAAATDDHAIEDARYAIGSPDSRRTAVIVRNDRGRESVRLILRADGSARDLATDAEHAEIRWASDGSLLYVWSRPTDWTDPRNGIYRVAP